MKGSDDIESYLLRLDMPYKSIGEGMWNIQDQDQENLVLSIAGPVIVFRLKVFQAPQAGREALFTKLLELNTTELLHGAFGLEGDAVVIVAALALENLDFNEFQSTIDDITMSVSNLYPELAKFCQPA